ncbi:zf-HC2 domain-containing protein [Novipirellula galeiformis]|uniref:zf-HC2 domain-containing protein n=1 Tax=Novipirellula galeiformis TaxID=2528004 RepID=UPI0036F290FA
MHSGMNRYAMGPLSSEMQNPFEMHLATCPRCQDLLLPGKHECDARGPPTASGACQRDKLQKIILASVL